MTIISSGQGTTQVRAVFYFFLWLLMFLVFFRGSSHSFSFSQTKLEVLEIMLAIKV